MFKCNNQGCINVTSKDVYTFTLKESNILPVPSFVL